MGWSALTDREGRFTLPGLVWYPGASYQLVVSAGDRDGRTTCVPAPESLSTEGVFSVGALDLSGDWTVLSDIPGLNAAAHIRYDFSNRDYYRKLFDDLTMGLISDVERVDAVNLFVAARLDHRQSEWKPDSPRSVLEKGSKYCGNLSEAMAAILAVGYQTRLVDMSDAAEPPNTHVVVEVFYGGGWHLYDPTFGVRFVKADGLVAGYKDLRLNPELVSASALAAFRRRYPRFELGWMPGVYNSGFHHVSEFAFECSQYTHAWWDYQGGLGHVTAGGRLWLAAAGIRPGSRVTYHIRRPGSSNDELSFTTRSAGNRRCVLDHEESPAITLPAGTYEVFVDLEDGNVTDATTGGLPSIANWRLGKKLKVL
jgi:hypothetical protein